MPTKTTKPASKSPKGSLLAVVNHVFPRGKKIAIDAGRIKTKSPYVVKVFVDGILVARGTAKDWRQAYKAAQIDLSLRWFD